MSSTATPIASDIDLFWEPELKSLVRIKPSQKIGVGPFDDYPLLVKRADSIDGVRIFTVETTGPLRKRVTKSERVLYEHPCWQTFFTADQLMPA